MQETISGGSTVFSEISTWQRQWGGQRLKHGPERWIVDGRTVKTTIYRRGLKQGPVLGDGFSGQYLDDMKEGVWTDNGRWFKRTATWHRDRLEGPYSIAYSDGRRMELRFVAGRLTHFNGKVATNRLFDLLETDAMDRRIAEELQKNTEFDMIEVPLKDIVEYLKDRHAIPIVLDRRRLPNLDLPITATDRGIDLCSALTILTAANNLGCDYRYGCVWITTAQDAKDWHDPTGISKLQPPKDSAMARAWNEPLTIDVVKTPLAGLLSKIARSVGIEMDTTKIDRSPSSPSRFLVTHAIKNMPVRHVFGQLLYIANCQCVLDGDALVILPGEESQP
jgi:hypothetical protein